MHFAQRLNLFKFGLYVISHKEKLGVGLHNRCWGGIAIQEAQSHSSTVREYYGLSFSALKSKIKRNNATPALARNLVMGVDTLVTSLRAT
jgi:hypothetical protein